VPVGYERSSSRIPRRLTGLWDFADTGAIRWGSRFIPTGCHRSMGGVWRRGVLDSIWLLRCNRRAYRSEQLTHCLPDEHFPRTFIRMYDFRSTSCRLLRDSGVQIIKADIPGSRANAAVGFPVVSTRLRGRCARFSPDGLSLSLEYLQQQSPAPTSRRSSGWRERPISGLL